MKEIGGYFELENINTKQAIKGIMLNTARNALRYIVQVYNIKEIFAPYYTCPVVWHALEQEKVKINFYNINTNLEIADQNIPKNAFILVNNYFGIKGKYIKKLAKEYPYLIVDDAQSFYAPKKALAHFKSPRKFFGLPDGGIAQTSKKLSKILPKGISYTRLEHLLLRSDLEQAAKGYLIFKQNEELLQGLPIEEMSNLTQKLLNNCNFKKAKQIRLNNFKFLHKELKSKNLLKIDLDITDVPMVYPFLFEQKNLRNKLIKNKIYIAKYWPDIELNDGIGEDEIFLQNNLLPLPLDQRYALNDMQRVVNIIKRSLK